METKDHVNEFLAVNMGWLYRAPVHGMNHVINRTLMVLKDGTHMSVQASRYHYCEPRDDNGPYSAVEVGMPNCSIPELLPYAEDPANPSSTVYPYTPVAVLNKVIEQRGGIMNIWDLAKHYANTIQHG